MITKQKQTLFTVFYLATANPELRNSKASCDDESTLLPQKRKKKLGCVRSNLEIGGVKQSVSDTFGSWYLFAYSA